MSYLHKYKVGNYIFRTLSEGRMQLTALHNAIRYTYPAPRAIINVNTYLKNAVECRFEKVSDLQTILVPSSPIIPEAARALLEKRNKISLPESFVMNIPEGRVLGNGTVVVKDNVILADTTTDFHRKQEYHNLLSAIRVPAPEQFNGRLAIISSPGSNNYFHWTLDAMPRLELLKKIDSLIDAYYINDQHPFHKEWLKYLAIPSKKIISATPARHIQASELIVPSFAGLPGIPSPTALHFLRSFVPPTSDTRRQRIYISRSTSRRRRITNENEILPLLEEAGFTPVFPGQMSVCEQTQLFATAEAIIAAHGAELTNLVWCRPGTQILELFSPYYLNPCFKELAALCNLSYSAIVGKGGHRILRKSIDTHYVWANIQVPVNTFKDTLKMLHS